MFRVCLVFILVAAFGCNNKSATETAKEQVALQTNVVDSTSPLVESSVVAIAKVAVAENDTWSDQAEYTVTKETTSWTVLVWRIPKQPGGFRIISIDHEGKILDYERGH